MICESDVFRLDIKHSKERDDYITEIAKAMAVKMYNRQQDVSPSARVYKIKAGIYAELAVYNYLKFKAGSIDNFKKYIQDNDIKFSGFLKEFDAQSTYNSVHMFGETDTFDFKINGFSVDIKSSVEKGGGKWEENIKRLKTTLEDLPPEIFSDWTLNTRNFTVLPDQCHKDYTLQVAIQQKEDRTCYYLIGFVNNNDIKKIPPSDLYVGKSLDGSSKTQKTHLLPLKKGLPLATLLPEMNIQNNETQECHRKRGQFKP